MTPAAVESEKRTERNNRVFKVLLVKRANCKALKKQQGAPGWLVGGTCDS